MILAWISCSRHGFHAPGMDFMLQAWISCSRHGVHAPGMDFVLGLQLRQGFCYTDFPGFARLTFPLGPILADRFCYTDFPGFARLTFLLGPILARFRLGPGLHLHPLCSKVIWEPAGTIGGTIFAKFVYIDHRGASSKYARTTYTSKSSMCTKIRKTIDRFSDRNMLIRFTLLFGSTVLSDPQNTFHLYGMCQR